jgi:hypothetical protein
MTKADYQFFQDYADAFRWRHNYTGHRTVHLRHLTQEAVMVLHALLLSFPKKEQTLTRLRGFAATMGAAQAQHRLSSRTERERIHGKLWAELAVDESVLARIFALPRC